MQRLHMHMPGWVHRHKADWHTLGTHLSHITHDPRFWAALAMTILLLAMIIAAIYSKSAGTTPLGPTYPSYPYVP